MWIQAKTQYHLSGREEDSKTWTEEERKDLDGQGNKNQVEREVGNQGGKEKEEERVHE